jgi:hypothetical protein
MAFALLFFVLFAFFFPLSADFFTFYAPVLFLTGTINISLSVSTLIVARRLVRTCHKPQIPFPYLCVLAAGPSRCKSTEQYVRLKKYA